MSWTRYIQGDLKARIESGQGLPPKLTLDGLSRHYNVSMTPVRLAIDGLVDAGYIRRLSNRRLRINPARVGARAAPSPAPQPPVDHQERITRDLVALSLGGEPVFLREEETAQRYSISRTIVRHVFNRLAGSGLIEHLPRRGWRLRPFRQEDLDAFTDVRVPLEKHALLTAWTRMEPARLEALIDANSGLTGADGRPQSDNSLHGYFIERAGNPYIRDFFDRYGRYFAVIFDFEGLDDNVLRDTARQHRRILQAILDDDKTVALDRLEHHIRHNHPILKGRGALHSTATPAAVPHHAA